MERQDESPKKEGKQRVLVLKNWRSVGTCEMKEKGRRRRNRSKRKKRKKN